MDYRVKTSNAVMYIFGFLIITFVSCVFEWPSHYSSLCPLVKSVFKVQAAPVDEEEKSGEVSAEVGAVANFTARTSIKSEENITATGESEENPEAAVPPTVGAADESEFDSTAVVAAGNSTVKLQDDIFEAEVNCSSLPPFSSDMFSAQPNESAVYLQPDKIKPSPFTDVGFNDFISVFGFHILASEDISDTDIIHYAKIFAKYVDNDEDGKPDRPDAMESILGFSAQISIFRNATYSEKFWVETFRKTENKEFRELFFCRIHFFEQWLSDSSVEYHIQRNKLISSGAAAADSLARETDDDEKICTDLKTVDFDWPLWYFVFTIAYYGYLEVFTDEQKDVLEKFARRAKEADYFNGNYPDDVDMELADFLSWVIITSLGALKCHCDIEVIKEVWKLCTIDGLDKFDPELLKFVQSIEGMPTTLPNGEYSSSAVVKQ